MSKSKKRKIIEVYVTENKKEHTTSFEFIKTEDSKIANATIKGLAMMFTSQKDEDDELEVEYE